MISAITDVVLQKELRTVLARPWYSGCPLGNLPLMPVEKTSRGLWIFMISFWFIYITQLIVVEPKLDVWYFLLSTTLCSAKLLMSFLFTYRSNPGFIKQGEEDELTMSNLIAKVPAKHICFECKVIKPPGSHHC